ITSNMLTDLSEGMEMLYLFAFAFGKHSAASMVHLLFTAITPLGMLAFGKRIGQPKAGAIGALLFFLSPAVALVGTAAYVDLAAAAVVFAVFYLLQIWWQEQTDALLIPLGMLAGFAYGVKYSAGIAVPYAIGGILIRRRGSGKPLWKPCATVAVTAFALMSPWIVKNAVVIHNPVAPLANRVFPNAFRYVSTEHEYVKSINARAGLTGFNWFYQITTRGVFTQGFLGPVFLIAPLALFSARSRVGRQVVCAAVVFLLPCIAAVPSRYFIPALTFGSLGLGLVLSRYAHAGASVVLLHTMLCWPAAIPKYAARNAPRMEWPDWRAALRLTPESGYLSQRVEGYGLGLLLDDKLRPDERVFAFRAFQQAYHSRQVIVAWESALGVRLGEAVRAAFDSSLQPAQRYVFSFESVTLSKFRLIQTGREPDTDQWSVSELRVFHNGRELPRAAQWRLSASPNPWDVQLAFDNSPLTRWASRQRPAEAMFIEVNFGTSETVDRVVVDCLPNQTGIDLGLQIEDSRGIWRNLTAGKEMSTNPMPPALRRAAVEELQRHGIGALAVHDLDAGAKDFERRQAQWGIELAGASGRYRLYKFKR
ncbi:MAG: glycosyltransferase family 39 protein, partial [Acidobacteriota bacterium]|nr:glycosyltransferase family 39 protein [Acidobacteriota bacterium]